MAAKDYVFVTGMANVYLAKKTKGPAMSQDRRQVTDNEILGMFEFYLRNWSENKKDETLVVCDGSGKLIFEAKLL